MPYEFEIHPKAEAEFDGFLNRDRSGAFWTMSRPEHVETAQGKPDALEALRQRGMEADGFLEGYNARAVIMRVAQEIRSMRINAGLTQTQLAQRAGMSQPEISRLEAGVGTQGPGVETLSRLAAACNKEFVPIIQDPPTPAKAEVLPSS